MSAFLGPIHYWLYNKIQLQQNIVDELYELGSQNGLSLKEESNRLFGSFENKPLEEMIDHGNIHGWLQEQVSRVEYKYAYSITKLLEKNPEALSQIKSMMELKGITLAKTIKDNNLNAEGIYKAIGDNLLDGMPCDHANRIAKQSGDEVVWVREVCVHSPYWDEVGGDIQIYYDLRDAWLKGLIQELGYSFEKKDAKTYGIVK